MTNVNSICTCNIYPYSPILIQVSGRTRRMTYMFVNLITADKETPFSSTPINYDSKLTDTYPLSVISCR